MDLPNRSAVTSKEKSPETPKEDQPYRKMIMRTLSSNPLALALVFKEYQDDKEVVLIAVHQNGLALQYASERLRNDKEVALVAIKQNPDALEFVGEALKADEDFFALFGSSDEKSGGKTK